MNHLESASFKFENYRITNFSFSDPENDEQELNIGFNPSGLFIRDSSTYILEFEFSASGEDDGKQIINAKMIGIFKFENISDLKDIPQYFYQNSIAIVFPFMRSFVSTLTMMGGIKHLLLPILNLSSLEKTLKENTYSTNIEFTDSEGPKLIE
jgi:preprotein translocase subunit SecB